MMQTFSSIIFVNCILHVYVVLDPPLSSVYIQPCREMIVIKLTKVERAEAEWVPRPCQMGE